ncbi:glycosyltransferase family 2 protein [Blastococcus sp. SYSU DS0510]
MPFLRLLAVNYFGASLVEGLLRSLVAQHHGDWHLVVVDNSESEHQASALRAICSSDSRTEVLVAPSNLGYIHAAEWARSVLPDDATWTAVCNTDLSLSESFVSRLSALRSDAAVLAPDIVAMPSARRQNPYMKKRPTVSRMASRRLVLSFRWSARLASKLAASRKKQTVAPPLGPRDIYAPHGSFMLFNRVFFEHGGSLRHGTFLFGEEITIAERVRRLGLRVVYEPTLEVCHLEHQATGTVRTGTLFRAQREAVVHGYRLIAGKEVAD